MPCGPWSWEYVGAMKEGPRGRAGKELSGNMKGARSMKSGGHEGGGIIVLSGDTKGGDWIEWVHERSEEYEGGEGKERT